MLNQEDFKKTLTEALERKFPDAAVTETKVAKVNDRILTGLVIRNGDGPAPIYYMEEAYEAYSGGEDIESIISSISRSYESTADQRNVLLPKLDMSFESIKDKLFVRILEQKRNKEYLKEKLYMPIPYCGLVFTCDICINGEMRSAITEQMAETEGYDVPELFRQAIENTGDPENIFLSILEDLALNGEEALNLFEDSAQITNTMPAYTLTNREKHLGAAVLFCPGIAEKIALKLGCGYYAIPSSIHEMLIVPETMGEEHGLRRLLRDVNRSGHVGEDEILSDELLYYDIRTGMLKEIPDKAFS